MAEQSTILTWNVPNWITVILMVGVFYLLMTAITKAVKGTPTPDQGQQ